MSAMAVTPFRHWSTQTVNECVHVTSIWVESRFVHVDDFGVGLTSSEVWEWKQLVGATQQIFQVLVHLEVYVRVAVVFTDAINRLFRIKVTKMWVSKDLFL